MSVALRPPLHRALIGILIAIALVPGAPALAIEPSELESNLTITVDGVAKTLNLEAGMEALKIPSVSFALIDGDRIEFASAYGASATLETLYQAASLSKFVAAVGAMRLVEAKRLDLDADVNTKLTSWKVPSNGFDQAHPVTLRGLLSMTAGIGVPGFLGYEIGVPVPNLTQILYGAPPANSPPVTVIAEPGSVYRYSGGSYEVAEALMVDTMQTSFPDLMSEIVLKPAGMARSTFAQELPADLARQAMRGHLTDGSKLPGGYHLFPEHAAAGLWSTPTDLANLLLLIGRSWRGESQLFLRPETARQMLTPQNDSPYGLGAAIGEAEGALAVMKRGQNVGYQAYLILLPAEGKGMVVMTNSDNGAILAEALIRRAAKLFGWPALGTLAD
ncbi:MAG: beta-lactamase family protein [Methyloceanibacter sp.]|nr:beta-lactamase family protein [Methyloceanibacter sp.]